MSDPAAPLAGTDAVSRRLREALTSWAGVLAVLPADSDWVHVFLHGNGGKDLRENVIQCLRQMPEVAEVRVSEITATILRVRLNADGD